MRRYALGWCWIAVCSVLFGIPLMGQSAMERNSPQADNTRTRSHLGYPQDWSSSHILMPGMSADDVLAAGEHEPRHVYNMVMREVAVQHRRFRAPRPAARARIDWAVSLENGYVPASQFPAKYQFDVTVEDCNTDYVVFGLTGATSGQANLVGINNVYTSANPPCNNGSPWVSFAANTVTHTGGQIQTSPVISEDGTKIAFVESTNKASYFHVLVLPNPIPAPPAQAGTVVSPRRPTSCTAPTIPGCMTTLTIQTTATDSNSSPWVDYNTDTAYVGADNGVLYKITPVFGGGAPTKVTTGGWPVTLASNKVLTAPVVDDTAGRIFVGDSDGYLYAVDMASPGGTYAARQAIGWVTNVSAGTGVVDPPIVVTDPANTATDQVFAFTGCSSVLGIGGAVTQLPADFVTGSPTASNTVDLGSASGTGNCTGKNVHSGTFDNQFWIGGSTSGHLIACGFQSGTSTNKLAPSYPKMYFFPFASNVITSTGSSTFVVNTSLGDECSPLTEFYDGTTDRLFFGVGGTNDGYVEGSTITTGLSTPVCSTGPTSSCVKAPTALEGTSGIVIDNLLSNGGTNIYFSTLAAGSVNGQKCTASGGTANPKCAVKLTQTALQ